MTNSRLRCVRAIDGCLLSAGVLCTRRTYSRSRPSQPHMGTLVRIQLYAADAGRPNAGFRAAFERIAQLDAMLSDYRADSEVNRLCRAAVGTPVKVSADLFRVLAAARQLAEETDGAFDVTLGPVTQLWRQARRQHRLPAPRRCPRGAGNVRDTASCIWTPPPERSRSTRPACDWISAESARATLRTRHWRRLAELGIRRALVAASGDLAIGDPPPGKPRLERLASIRTVGLRSGFSRGAESLQRGSFHVGRSRTEPGDRRGEVFTYRGSGDRDGPHRQVAVTVVARHGIDADSWSTALSVLGAATRHAADRRTPGAVRAVDHGYRRGVESPAGARLAAGPSKCTRIAPNPQIGNRHKISAPL